MRCSIRDTTSLLFQQKAEPNIHCLVIIFSRNYLLFSETWQVSKQIENKQNILPGAGLAGLVSGVIKSEFEMRIRGFLLRGVDNMSGSRSLKKKQKKQWLASFWRDMVLLMFSYNCTRNVKTQLHAHFWNRIMLLMLQSNWNRNVQWLANFW